MYDEVVRRLRNCATEAAPCLTCDMVEDESCLKTLMNQAADVIEELSKDRDKWKATAQEERDAYWHWFDNYQREVPSWIPVTERLPEQFKLVLVYYNRNGYSCTGVAEYYHDGDTKVWRGCGFIPTHWMPLPEPPKEECA